MKDLAEKIIAVEAMFPYHTFDMLLEGRYGDEIIVEVDATTDGRVRVYDDDFTHESLYLEDYLATVPDYKVKEIRHIIPIEDI